MSKTFIGGGIGREFELEAAVAEIIVRVCSCEQFSVQMFLESGGGRETFGNCRQSSRQLVP